MHLIEVSVKRESTVVFVLTLLQLFSNAALKMQGVFHWDDSNRSVIQDALDHSMSKEPMNPP